MSVGESRRAAIIAVAVATILTLAKIIVGLVTGSLAVLAAAVDNFLDLTCSGINVFFLGLAEKPPDEEHRFGHGKADALSGVIQATLIGGGGLVMAGLSVWKLIAGTPSLWAMPGIVVSLASLVVSTGLGLYLRHKAKVTGSIALRADAFHYLTDIATNAAAAIALVLVSLTGSDFWDPLGSVLISLYIVYEAFQILRVSANELLDQGLPNELEDAIIDAIASLGHEVRGFTHLRTRKAGRTVFIELHLSIDPVVSFQRSHELTEALINELRRRFGPNTQVMIDTDPA
ncbi:MAG: cation transporter [Acidobacteria bacterium]|nr:cation transporter [Acidobacteriota bacterium]